MLYSLRYPDLTLHLQLSDVLPTKRIREEISLEPLETIEAVYIYGIGRCGPSLWKWLEENSRRQLIFLEDDLAALVPAAEWLNHPQIHLKWVLSSSLWPNILEECAAQFSYEHIQIIATQAYARRPVFRKIQESLQRRTLLWHSVTSEEISGHLLHRNIIANLHRLSHCSYVNAWEGAWKGVPVIICGAGPSLEACADELRQVQDRALIFACGSALSALSHLGIRPHLGIAIDPNAREFDCLKGCSYRDLPLLFASRLYPKVFELFEGPYGYIRCGSGGALESYIEHELGLNDPFLGQDLGREALSVTTLAVSLARHWGCNPIIFAGVDLAYTQDTHYSKGVLAEQIPITGALRRQGVKGKFVKTTLKWIMERDTFDTYARNHPEVTFLNTSTGLKFSHIPSAPLQEVLSSYSSMDMTGRLNRLMDEKKINAQHIPELFHTIKLSVERCLTLLLSLQQEESGSGKAILYESDLELEIAYRLLLEPPLLALERLGRTEVWGPLEEIARSYL